MNKLTAAESIETEIDAIVARATNPNFTREDARRVALYAAHNPAGTKFTRWLGPKAKAAGLRGATWTAEEVAEIIPEGLATVLYVSFGHVNGLEGFSRNTIVRFGDRIMAVLPDGNVSIAYPLETGRALRVLVK